MANGLVLAADELIQPAINYLIQTGAIQQQEGQLLFNAYGTRRGEFQQIMTQNFPQGCSKDTIKSKLMEFLSHLLKAMRQVSQQQSWGNPNQPFEQPQQFNQQLAFGGQVNPYADAQPIQPIQPAVVQQSVIPQPTIQSKTSEEMFDMNTMFTKATPIGDIKEVSITRFINGRIQLMKHDTSKLELGQYKLLRGYNNFDEAIKAISVTQDKYNCNKYPYIRFIQYNKLMVLDVPQYEACVIFDEMFKKTQNKQAEEVIKIIAEVLETVSAGNSRSITQFFVDRINEVLPFVTYSKTVATSITIDNFIETLELLGDTTSVFLNRIRSIDGYDEVISDIIKDTILSIINNTTVCDFGDDESALGDVLHASGNQHIIDGYTNRDYYLLATKAAAEDKDNLDFETKFDKLNELLSTKTVINVKHMVICTNLYPEEYRLQAETDDVFIITDPHNHVDQLLNELIKIKCPTTLIICPYSTTRNIKTFNVSRTIDKILRISKT